MREKTLRDAQKQLASITGIYNKQKDILDEMLHELNRLVKESEKYLGEINFNPDIVSNYNSFAYKLTQDIKMQEQIIERTKQDVLRQQEVTKKAYIEVKSLENLKDKQKEKYNQEFLAEECKQIDDIVNSRRRQ